MSAVLPSSVGAARKVSLNWSHGTMTCHSFNCFGSGLGTNGRLAGH